MGGSGVGVSRLWNIWQLELYLSLFLFPTHPHSHTLNPVFCTRTRTPGFMVEAPVIWVMLRYCSCCQTAPGRLCRWLRMCLCSWCRCRCFGTKEGGASFARMGGDNEEHSTLELGRTVGARGTGGTGGVCVQEAQEGAAFALVVGEQTQCEAEVDSASAIRG